MKKIQVAINTTEWMKIIFKTKRDSQGKIIIIVIADLQRYESSVCYEAITQFYI